MIFIGILAIVFIGSIVAMMVLPIQPAMIIAISNSEKPNIEITIYGGELSDNRYGFGFSPSNLTTPGPLLRFKTTDIVKITFINAGKLPHAFLITDAPITESNPFFNAAIGSTKNPISSGQSGTVIFHPERTGSYFYISPLSGDTELGMWGNVQVPIN